MQPFTTLTAVAAPLDHTNIDTDRIIPARFLTKPRSVGLGQYAFHDMRFNQDGSKKPEFPLNQPALRQARILVADDNFGCGSSRESAVWALEDLGIRSIIAPSFGDIFYNNCCKNGLLPIRLPDSLVRTMRAHLGQNPGTQITIDLPAQTVTASDGATHSFDIDPFRKECLVKGLDDIDLTLQYEDSIVQYEANRRANAPWSIPALVPAVPRSDHGGTQTGTN